MTRIALLGNFGSENLGNEASARAVASVLRHAILDIELCCICPRPGTAAQQHGMPCHLLRPGRRLQSSIARPLLRLPRAVGDLARAVRMARSVDAIIVPGTGILDDYGDVPTGMPYDLSIWSLATKMARRPLHLIAVGAGPISSAASRRLLRLAARLASTRSYRDYDSRDFMASIGLDVSADGVMPDVVFALPIHAPAPAARERPVIGVGLMDYDGWALGDAAGPTIRARYLEGLARVVVELVGQGCDAELVFGETSDEAALASFLQLLPEEVRRHVHPTEMPPDLETLSQQIGRCDVAVVSRFHSALVAMMTGVPTVSLGYAPKNEALLAQFGLAPYCHDIESFDPVRVAKEVRELQVRRAALTNAMLEVRAGLAIDVARELERLVENVRT